MLIYAIVAVIVWVAVNLFFWKISLDLEKEVREEMRDYKDCDFNNTDEAKFGKYITRLTGFIISIPAALTRSLSKEEMKEVDVQVLRLDAIRQDTRKESGIMRIHSRRI